jgi:hypothetical protein
MLVFALQNSVLRIVVPCPSTRPMRPGLVAGLLGPLLLARLPLRGDTGPDHQLRSPITLHEPTVQADQLLMVVDRIRALIFVLMVLVQLPYANFVINQDM